MAIGKHDAECPYCGIMLRFGCIPASEPAQDMKMEVGCVVTHKDPLNELWDGCPPKGIVLYKGRHSVLVRDEIGDEQHWICWQLNVIVPATPEKGDLVRTNDGEYGSVDIVRGDEVRISHTAAGQSYECQFWANRKGCTIIRKSERR